jgi:hypothetical protein
MNMICAIDAARRMLTPSVENMIASLPDLGDSLNTAAVDLAHDCTLERVDMMLSRIKGAESSLIHLRKALAAEGGPPDGQI